MYGQFSYSGPQALEGIAGVGIGLVVGFAVLAALVSLGLCVVIYVFQSLSCYTIAKRRGIHNPWLAWIPVGNMWILGSISDQYQYVKKGNVRNRRKSLLWLTVAMYALALPTVITEIAVVVQAVTGWNVDVLSPAIITGALSIATACVTLAGAIVQYIAYYDLYASCQPGNSVLYLVLSILFSITLPVFLFVCRNKDEGMPPRRQTPPVQPQWEPTEEDLFETDELTEEDFEE